MIKQSKFRGIFAPSSFEVLDRMTWKFSVSQLQRNEVIAGWFLFYILVLKPVFYAKQNKYLLSPLNVFHIHSQQLSSDIDVGMNELLGSDATLYSEMLCLYQFLVRYTDPFSLPYIFLAAQMISISTVSFFSLIYCFARSELFIRLLNRQQISFDYISAVVVSVKHNIYNPLTPSFCGAMIEILS